MSRDPEEHVALHEGPDLMKIMKFMKFLIFDGLEPDLRRISRGALRCRAMFKVTRRAYKL